MFVWHADEGPACRLDSGLTMTFWQDVKRLPLLDTHVPEDVCLMQQWTTLAMLFAGRLNEDQFKHGKLNDKRNKKKRKEKKKTKKEDMQTYWHVAGIPSRSEVSTLSMLTGGTPATIQEQWTTYDHPFVIVHQRNCAALADRASDGRSYHTTESDWKCRKL